MKNLYYPLIFSVLLSIGISSTARAEVIDTSTISCEKLVAAANAKTEKSMSFVNGILNWMSGYHATEAQGTVVDWKKLSKAFDATVAYCVEHPNVGIMSASDRFMGEHLDNGGPDAFDLAIVTCETVISDSSPLLNLGDTFMWLAGYHTSFNKDSTSLDIEKFIEDTGQVAEYCTSNPQVGIVTASEKFMSEEK